MRSLLQAIAVAATALVAMPFVAEASTDKRMALVIGNARYADAPLRNPANDARAMAASLRERGFEVILQVDASKQQMEAAIIEFGEKLSQGATGLFFFAGHGMQVNGRNYIIPTDAKLSSEQRVKLETIDIDAVLDQMQGARSKVNVVILDACRNNPFERRFRSASGGLAQINAPEGTLIAYSTAPGRVAADGEGANGLYTSELLKALRAPGIKLEDVFKQVRINVARASNGAQTPWEASSLVGDFYFIPPAPVAAPAQINTAEFEFWNSIRTASDPGEYRAYLSRYPKGEFTDLAQMRLAAIERSRVDAVEKARQDAAEKARLDAAEKARAEAAERTRLEIERIRQEVAERSRLEIEKARAEAAEKARQDAADRARLEAAERARADAADKARADAVEKARLEIEQIRREMAERSRLEVQQVRADAAEKARLDAADKARLDAAEKALSGAGDPNSLSIPSGPLTASQKRAFGIPVTYADLEGRQFFARQNYANGQSGFDIRFDFSGSDPARVMVYGRIEIESGGGKGGGNAIIPHTTCSIYGFERFKQNLQFTAYCNGNTMVVGDLSTMSASFMIPRIGPAATVIDTTYSDRHREWTTSVTDNNTTAFFQNVLKEALVNPAAAPRPVQQAALSPPQNTVVGFDGVYRAKFTMIAQDGFTPIDGVLTVNGSTITGSGSAGTGGTNADSCAIAGRLDTNTGNIVNLGITCRRLSAHLTGRFADNPQNRVIEAKTEARALSDGRVVPITWVRDR